MSKAKPTPLEVLEVLQQGISYASGFAILEERPNCQWVRDALDQGDDPSGRYPSTIRETLTLIAGAAIQLRMDGYRLALVYDGVTPAERAYAILKEVQSCQQQG